MFDPLKNTCSEIAHHPPIFFFKQQNSWGSVADRGHDVDIFFKIGPVVMGSKVAKSFIGLIVLFGTLESNQILVTFEVVVNPSSDYVSPPDFGTFRHPLFIEAPRTKFMQYSA